VLAVTVSTLVWAARHRSGPWTVVCGRALALVILVGWVGEYAAEVALGTWSVKYNLPLQLTDAVSAVAVAALWSRRALLVELVYFWSLTATLQAVITPDLGQTFPNIYYFTYFTYHIGAVLAACFLVFGCRLYPRRRAFWRVFALTAAFALIAGAGDLLTGGNYMYLRAKPAHNSLLNVMGPWPVYIVATAALGLVMFLLLQWFADWASRTELGAGLRQ
jgi:hypothetical integral membrane protein (TIGR02206 family)